MRALVIGLVLVAGLPVAVAAYLLLTTEGSALLIRQVLTHLTRAEHVSLGSVEGRLLGGVTVQALEVAGPGPLAEEHVISAEQAALSGLDLAHLTGSQVELHDVTLQLAGMPEELTIARVTGTPFAPWSFHEVEVRGLRRLPPGSTLSIQRVDAALPLTPDHLREIHNARLRVPDTDPFVIFATQQRGELEGRLYAKTASLRELLDLLGGEGLVPGLSGALADVDLALSGSARAPRLEGSFLGPRLRYRALTLRDCQGTVDLTTTLTKTGAVARGVVTATAGILTVRQTEIMLQPSRLEFVDASHIPRLDVTGKAKVGGTAIRVVVTGTAAAPELKLSSEPPLPQGVLLVMLATGKAWKGVETAVTEARMTADLAKDAVDYFVLGGLGTRLGKRLKIEEVSIVHDPETATKGIGVTTGIREDLSIHYGATRVGEVPTKATTTHAVGVEHKVTETDSIQLEAEKKVAPASEGNRWGVEKAAPDEVMLKYKKRF